MDVKQATTKIEKIIKGTPFVSFYVEHVDDNNFLWAGYMVVVPPKGSLIAVQDIPGEETPVLRKVKSVTWNIIEDGIYVSVGLNPL